MAVSLLFRNFFPIQVFGQRKTIQLGKLKLVLKKFLIMCFNMRHIQYVTHFSPKVIYIIYIHYIRA